MSSTSGTQNHRCICGHPRKLHAGVTQHCTCRKCPCLIFCKDEGPIRLPYKYVEKPKPNQLELEDSAFAEFIRKQPEVYTKLEMGLARRAWREATRQAGEIEKDLLAEIEHLRGEAAVAPGGDNAT